jgi:hypothetical protein
MRWVRAGVMLGLAAWAVVALAALGEPQSAWLICDILGMEVCHRN